jgi:hypothetical protein
MMVEDVFGHSGSARGSGPHQQRELVSDQGDE